MRARGPRERRVWPGRLAALLLGLAALAIVLPTVFIGVRCARPGVEPPRRDPLVERTISTVKDYTRGGAATYLTVPEWYIVYSTEEYARWLDTGRPSGFPYLGASRQYWEYYGAMCDASRDVYPFDAGVHLMLGVIGVSFTGENLVRAGYENTVGRLTEWLGGHATAEDDFARRTAAEYGRFMHGVPWYEFPFARKARALWAETPWWGPAPVRKWERRLVLTAEYGIKAAYGWLIRQGTGAVYQAEDLRIHAWITDAPAAALADARVRKVADAPGGAIVLLPRYEAFTDAVRTLAAQGVRFRDVAGNDAIVLSGLGRRGQVLPPDAGEVLFRAPIPSEPGAVRLVLRTPVTSLHASLAALPRAGVRLEHVYDY
jgi:hypothetical protein